MSTETMAYKSQTILRVESLCGRVEALECSRKHSENLKQSGALEHIHEAKEALWRALAALDIVGR